MKLKIEITVDNEAFSVSNGSECARILRDLSRAELDGATVICGDHGGMRDYNGNTVGTWKVTR